MLGATSSSSVAVVSDIGLKAAVGHVAGLWCAFLPIGGDPPQ